MKYDNNANNEARRILAAGARAARFARGNARRETCKQCINVTRRVRCDERATRG